MENSTKKIGCLLMVLPAIVFIILMLKYEDVGSVEGTTMWVVFFVGVYLYLRKSQSEKTTIKSDYQSVSPQATPLSSDVNKLVSKIVEAVGVLESEYKILPEPGKFEVIFSTGLIALEKYKHEKLNYNDAFENEFFKSLFSKSNYYIGDLKREQYQELLKARLQFYPEELDNIFSGQGYIPGTLYNAFYITPLKVDLEPSFDLGEILKFIEGYKRMINWLDEEIYKI